MTIAYLIHFIRHYCNSYIVYKDDNLGITVIPLIIRKEDPDKTKVRVTTKQDPEGFILYGNGDVETEGEFDRLNKKFKELPETERDKFLISMFGVFR